MWEQCTKCNKYKAFWAFDKRVGSCFGIRGECKCCRRLYKKEYVRSGRSCGKIKPLKGRHTYNKMYYEKNKTYIKELNKNKYYTLVEKMNNDINFKNEYLDKQKIRSKIYRKNHPEKKSMGDFRRRSYLKKATPAWADKEIINYIYKEKDKLNNLYGYNKFEVHHIYPLMSQKHLFCGLHCENNLVIVDKDQHIMYHRECYYFNITYTK